MEKRASDSLIKKIVDDAIASGNADITKTQKTSFVVDGVEVQLKTIKKSVFQNKPSYMLCHPTFGWYSGWITPSEKAGKPEYYPEQYWLEVRGI
jgi:hypothetical protein